MQNGWSSRFFWAISLLVVALTNVPYLYANALADPQHVFGGFLLNPQDGYSYLAKMVQGEAGNWRFTLPFTAEPGSGAYLFLFYLGLGHLVRLLGMPSLIVFHLARSIATVIMLLALYRFFASQLSAEPQIRSAFMLACLGGGLGWLTVPWGGFTADFWVAEAYPFLSAYANPHFPLGIGLTLLLLTPTNQMRRKEFLAFPLSLLLGLVMPFGVVIAVGLLGVSALLDFIEVRQLNWQCFRFAWATLGGGLILLYDLWVVYSDPAFASWNAQNQTPTPDPFNLAISFSPALIVGLIGSRNVFRERRARSRLLVIWLAVVLVLIYLPVNLQRRLLAGFYIPCAGLTVIGVFQIFQKRFRLVMLTILILSLPTNLLVLLAARHGAQNLEPQLYLTHGEAEAFRWLVGETAADALILAAPETGLRIPAFSGRRVLYGHPFETVDALREETLVRAYFTGDISREGREAFLQERGVDYVFWGPRERELAQGSSMPVENLVLMYERGGVGIYALSP